MIEGVETRELQVNADERGHLVELYRSDWPEFDPEPAMTYYSMSYPGVVRAWHRHEREQVDYFACPSGRIRVGVYDDREGSPTREEANTFVVGEHAQELVRIPGDCWHGFEVIGDEQALLVNFPTNRYDYDDPDELRLPADTDRIPIEWRAHE